MNAAPKVAAVHDLTGFGRCSLTVALPVLGAMGCQCCPVPTAYLSAHTGFPASERASFLDMTGQLPRTAEHWGELGVALDAIYSGFLSSAEQIGLLGEFIGRFRQAGTLVLVDPVMGDHGRAYRTYTGEMCEKMKSLCDRADLITPNLTEAALLLDEPYCASPGPDQVRRTLERLSLEGKRSVVITGVSAGEGQVGAACLDRETGRTCIAMSRREEGQYPGTGDLFASVLLGALLRGGELRSAAECAVEFVRRAVRRTLELGTPILEGVQFEGLLDALVNREEIT